MKHKYHVLYKTTNTVTGKFYIGMHSTNDLDDGYLGSGIHLLRSIKKYGKENHKVVILDYAKDRQELSLMEANVVTAEVVDDPLCMNMKLGGIGGYGLVHTDEAKAKISAKNKGHKNNVGIPRTAETKKKISESWKTRVVSDETKKKQSEARRGIIPSLDARIKRSTSRNAKWPLFGKPIIVDDTEFPSVYDASQALGIEAGKIIYWIKSQSKKFPKTYYKE